MLNFANPENPGGGVQIGAMAQEECLCRSSNLFACISDQNVFDEYYGYHRSLKSHFYTDRLIYTKNVTVFKDDSPVPQMLPETDWFDVDVITCAAPYLGGSKYTNLTVLRHLFRSRIANILESALDNHVDTIVLGAFGCGAFKNPVQLVAEEFKAVIKNGQYCKKFKNIVFAIKKESENDYGENYKTFANVLHFPLTENCPTYDLPEVVLPTGKIIEKATEYVMLDSNITAVLYSNTLRFTIESSGKTVQFQKDVVEVGRDKKCDLLLEGKSTIARRQATFFYEKEAWFLRDNFSTNGTWLNGVKMQPGKKYQLNVNDEINFAMAEKVIFDKRTYNTQPTGDPDAKALAFLEAGMSTFAKSDHKDEVALKLIIAALSDAPLYFPVEIDMEAMFGEVNPTKLKAGDTLQPTKDVKMRILTLKLENGVEFVPMFTSNDEAKKGPSASIIRFYPQDYLPKLVQMDKPVIINLFSENRFLLSKQLITEVLLPLVEKKTVPQPDVVEQTADKYIGKTIGGKYEVQKLIGHGGAYTTYLVKNIHDNKIWAMKLCDKTRQNYNSVVRENILTEPYMMQKLNHPAIPKVVDIIEDEDGIFIVRDYIEGETLETVVKLYGAQPTDKVIKWSKQM